MTQYFFNNNNLLINKIKYVNIFFLFYDIFDKVYK